MEKTAKKIANEFTMKRWTSPMNQDGHSDKEYFDLLTDEIEAFAQQEREISVKKALEILTVDFTERKEKAETLRDVIFLDAVLAVIDTTYPKVIETLNPH